MNQTSGWAECMKVNLSMAMQVYLARGAGARATPTLMLLAVPAGASAAVQPSSEAAMPSSYGAVGGEREVALLACACRVAGCAGCSFLPRCAFLLR
jgi:hypothetical protein